MAAIGILLMLVGFVMSLGGWVALLLQAFRNGFLWVVALVFVPFFAFVMLAFDFQKTWRPLLVNFAGGVIAQVGALLFVLDVQSQVQQSPSIVHEEPDVPAIPGVYVPKEEVPPGFLEAVDPMLFALGGGIGVFVIVGLLAGAVLIGGMNDESAEA